MECHTATLWRHFPPRHWLAPVCKEPATGPLSARVALVGNDRLRQALKGVHSADSNSARGSSRRGFKAPRATTVETLAPGPHHDKHGKKHDKHHSQSGSAEVDLMEWMVQQGLPSAKVALQERPALTSHQKPIHYLVASEDLQPGDVALQVPNNLAVTLERVLGDESIAELLTTNKLSELACLALYLMYEKKQGKKSFWYPFIHELDRQRGRGQLAVESPLLWKPEEVEEYLQGSPIKTIVQERLRGIEREYQELDTVWFMAGSLFKQYPFDIPTEAFSFEIFKQAFVAVQACVVHLQGVSLARRFALVPLGPPLLSYRSNCRAMLAAVEGHIQLTVDRVVKAGEPISVWCGPQPNSRLLLNYGFVDEDNPYDRLSVEAALDTSDPLYQKKRAIVQKNDLLTQNLFQVYKGKEREAVVQMMPYLRLGHVTDPLEMESVQFAQGPICGVSPCNEKAVLDQLETYFQGRLNAYKTTIQEDDVLIADKKTPPKQAVATKLLRIEKQILGNTLASIRELQQEIPQLGDVIPCSGSFRPKLQ